MDIFNNVSNFSLNLITLRINLLSCIMRYIISLSIAFLYSVCAASQSLTSALNSPRNGDNLIYYSIPAVQTDSAGKGVIWDISNISVGGKGERESFAYNKDSLLVYVTPHEQRRLYIKNDTVLCMGYATSNLEVSNLLPETEVIYPFCYGDSISGLFYGEGFYSNKLHFICYGMKKRKIDAAGSIILPDGDTLHHVLRLHESAWLGQKLSSSGSIKSHGDSLRFLPDSLLSRLETDSVTWHTETFTWYAAGYRYPIMKTVRNNIVHSDRKSLHFESSCYYPPEEWDFSLPDKDNEEMRMLLEKEDGMRRANSSQMPNCRYTCTMRGNILEVSLELDGSAEVELIAATQQGYILARTPKEILPKGTAVRRLDVSSVQPGVFIFTAIINGQPSSTKVTKQ